MPQTITAFVNDLIFSTKIASTGEALGVKVKIARRMPTLLERLAEPGDHLVLLDLDVESENPIEVIRAAKAAANPPRIIAFVSHLHLDLIKSARAAGADEVLARSGFAARLPSLLAGAAEVDVESTSPATEPS
jgi:CheY-like chemotaxis protein